MKILKLRLENIKCFEETEISFESGRDGARSWSLFVGDNGQGKTTILRSLALGLCDKEGASALRSELHGEFLRRGKDEGSIQVCLKDEVDNEKYTVKTSIRLEDDEESIYQEVSPGDCVGGKKNKGKAENFERNKIFAVGYGARRSVEGLKYYEEYASVDSLYTLFNYEFPLWNPEVGASRVERHSKKEWKKLQHVLKEVLMLEKDDKISLERTGLYFETKRGKDIFHTLSDGYKSLTSVILDFASWNLIYRESFDLGNISGIFILDEIEQHLHPRWQREIIKILSTQFPKVQFICSTHTPICALGLSDLECESRLFKVAHVNNHSEVEYGFDLREDFKGYRADQILTSDIFDLESTRSGSMQRKLEEYREIYLKEENKRDPKEKRRLREIEKELKYLPMWDDEEDKRRTDRLMKLFERQDEEKS